MLKTTLLLAALALAPAAALQSQESAPQEPAKAATQEAAQEAAPAFASHPYTLSTCAVSGEALGSMGDPVVMTVEGREVKLCCKGCVKAIEKEPAKYLPAVDAAHAAQQMAYYPGTCVISGEPLMKDGKDIGVDVMVGNRLFRTCCKMCAKRVTKDPSAAAAKLDPVLIEEQSKNYPMATCLVNAKGELGAVEDRVQKVVGNRLVQFCCPSCDKAFDKDPAAHLAKLDEAWKQARKK